MGRESSEPSEEARDAVDAITAQWAIERPDLDVGPMAVIGRIHRVGEILDRRLREVFATEGLANGDFDVLASLRRSGAPYALSPSELADTTMVTSGATTKRIDRLVGRGLVSREVAAGDGRGRVIRLTAEGKELVDRLHPRHLANEDRLLASLSPEQRAALIELLRTLLLDLDDE